MITMVAYSSGIRPSLNLILNVFTGRWIWYRTWLNKSITTWLIGTRASRASTTATTPNPPVASVANIEASTSDAAATIQM